jgi:nicotinate-nucleotide adenylyltransferase
MSSVALFAEINPSTLDRMDYAVFGGTFDPIHEGHVNALLRLCRVFPLTIVAPTKANPWKKDQAEPASLPLRLQMINLVLQAESIRTTTDITETGVFVSGLDYVYAEELVGHLRSKRTGKLYWVVGEDIADSVGHWKHWEKLDITAVIVPIVINTHSTLVRSGAAPAHPALAQFIREHHLYQG